MHDIRELIRLVDQSSLTKLEYEFEGQKIVLKKEEAKASKAIMATPELNNVVPAVEAPQQVVVQEKAVQQEAPAAAKPAPQVTANEEDGLHKITSPMVGTFYAAPAPDADPYVKAGDKVGDSTVVCIVEAMKLMNEIEAEVKGEIVKVLVENGQLVEYGQPLFLVKPE